MNSIFKAFCFKFICLTIIMLQSSNCVAQEMPLPVEDQVPLFVKILNYDRSLKNRGDDKVVIGIIYQEKFRKSDLTKEEFLNSIEDNSENTINGKPIECVSIEVSNLSNLERIIDNKNISVLYIAPLRSIEINRIYNISRRKKIITISGVSRYVRVGISVGLELVDEKPKILINRKASKEEGTDFTSQLLRLAILIN